MSCNKCFWVMGLFIIVSVYKNISGTVCYIQIAYWTSEIKTKWRTKLKIFYFQCWYKTFFFFFFCQSLSRKDSFLRKVTTSHENVHSLWSRNHFQKAIFLRNILFYFCLVLFGSLCLGHLDKIILKFVFNAYSTMVSYNFSEAWLHWQKFTKHS